ncbi:uncharacterized protein LOC129586836 isoform X2 [Paramacrobiotus metropolitanus]|nr:uncharacterized protein LOC129586836 isoform X2 [Paramacrobiotus metropolitanus]XP_055336277.1 uncharacterized protein LOC129586836 isoform X2 [Paramacrobiotus metropolitanus]
MAIRIHKHKQKMAMAAGMAAQEKLFLQDQLNLVQAKAERMQQQCEALISETDELQSKMRNTTMVYKQKTKHAVSEFHSKAFESRTNHLARYLTNQEKLYQQEKRYVGVLNNQEEATQYTVHLLQRLGEDVKLQGMQNVQSAKEDFLNNLQAQADAFENFFTDTQSGAEAAIKRHYDHSDRQRLSTFSNMLQSQERAISEMRKYFQGVNLANSGVIIQLKNTLNNRRAKLDQVEKDVFKTLEEYARFVAPIQTNDVEIKHCETELNDAVSVRTEHKKTWKHSKNLEEVVRRLQWRKEVEIVKLQKAQKQHAEIEKAYILTLMEASRKAGVACLIHERTRNLLNEEAVKYEIAKLIMNAQSPLDQDVRKARDQRISEIFKYQTEEIEHLRKRGNDIQQKYEHNRGALQEAFQKMINKPLSSTGFQFPSMESHLAQ